MSGQPLVYELTIKAPIAQVYRAFTNASALREWISDGATVQARPGGRMFLFWNEGYTTSGEYTAVEPDKLVAFTWYGKDDPAPTQISVKLEPRDDGTHLLLEHSELGDGEAWEIARKSFHKGWETGLENLVSILETGQDLRIVLRPMMGVLVGGFDKEVAATLGVPVEQGLRLDDVVGGMGAEAVGLRKDDVLVSLAGHPLDRYSSVSAALKDKRAGDVVEVVFYRGPEKKTVQMELSRRPLPPPQADGAALASAIQKEQEQVFAQLTEAFDGVSEAEADFHTSPGEWNAKEVLAHLIIGERDSNAYLAELVDYLERWSDDYAGNSNPRTKAVLEAYPSIGELMEELKRSMKETAAMVALLPSEFIAQKSGWWRVCFNYLQGPYHTNLHIEQIKASIAAARKS